MKILEMSADFIEDGAKIELSFVEGKFWTSVVLPDSDEEDYMEHDTLEDALRGLVFDVLWNIKDYATRVSDHTLLQRIAMIDRNRDAVSLTLG